MAAEVGSYGSERNRRRKERKDTAGRKDRGSGGLRKESRNSRGRERNR